jgi:creatinine amidohydrolase
VKKFVLFNTHGGQVGLLDPVARDLRARRGLLAISTSWFQWPLRGPDGEDINARFEAHEHRFGIHGGEIETSLMLALRPERVRMALAQHFRSSSEQRAATFELLGNGRSARFAWQTQDLNPSGAVGNAAAATAENGAALLDAAGRALAQLLAEIDRLPPDTLR